MVNVLCCIILAIGCNINANHKNDRIDFVIKDTVNCMNEYRKRYTIDGVPISYCDVPPRLELSSEQYLNLICEQLSKSNCRQRYLSILVLIDEEGLPNCITFMDEKVFKKELSEFDESLILEWINKLRFTPAKIGERSVSSFYFLTAKRDSITGEWAFPPYFK